MSTKETNIVLIVAAAILAAMGCWFCWRFPMEWLWGENQHHLFMRQLCANLVGCGVFVGAWALGWKRWLKAAPWIMVAWIGLLFMALMGRPINGVYRWIAIGPVRLNVQTALWPIAALFAAWLCLHRRVKPWMVFAAIGCFVAMMAYRIFSNANRVERIMVFFRDFDPSHAKIYMQCQMRTALEVANWFGCSGRSLRFLPCAHTDSIIAGSALKMGKWSPCLAIVFMGVIVAGLARIYQSVTDCSKRMYLVLFSSVLALTATWSCLQCLMLVPVFGCTFSLLGYGGTDVVFTWFGLGIALSCREIEDNSYEVSRRTCLPWLIAAVIVAMLMSAFVWAPRPSGWTFGEPPHRMTSHS